MTNVTESEMLYNAEELDELTCPACGWDFDGSVCGLCGYNEDNGSCPDCGTYVGFDGVVCDRCFYHGPVQSDERWIDRLKWWVRDAFLTIRGFRQRRANRLGPDDELPF